MKEDTYEGNTPAFSDDQARRLLDAPPAHTLKGKRDRAILSILLLIFFTAVALAEPTSEPPDDAVWDR